METMKPGTPEFKLATLLARLNNKPHASIRALIAWQMREDPDLDRYLELGYLKLEKSRALRFKLGPALYLAPRGRRKLRELTRHQAEAGN